MATLFVCSCTTFYEKLEKCCTKRWMTSDVLTRYVATNSILTTLCVHKLKTPPSNCSCRCGVKVRIFCGERGYQPIAAESDRSLLVQRHHRAQVCRYGGARKKWVKKV